MSAILRRPELKMVKRGCGCVRVFFPRHPKPESLSLGVYFGHQELSFSAPVDVFRPARDSTAIVDDREKKKSWNNSGQPRARAGILLEKTIYSTLVVIFFGKSVALVLCSTRRVFFGSRSEGDVTSVICLVVPATHDSGRHQPFLFFFSFLVIILGFFRVHFRHARLPVKVVWSGLR